MSLTKATGNMYPWVDAMHTQIGGECPHQCIYCYVKDSIPARFRKPGQSGRPARYQGPLRLLEEEFRTQYSGRKPRTIFEVHKNDIGAPGIPDEWILRILDQCGRWPKNLYVFQSKNPARFVPFLDRLPPRALVGTTIETTDALMAHGLSLAPPPAERVQAMLEIRKARPLLPTFVTLEPLVEFDVDTMAGWLEAIAPEFVNIGADSKKHNLPEPSRDKVMDLLIELRERRVEVRDKPNLERILGLKGATP